MRVPSDKPRPWIRWRHRAVQTLLRPVLRLFYGWTYRYRGERYREEDPRQPYLILSNHNGAVDPILLALSFRQPIYFVASDHIFRWGFVSKIIRYVAAPIPIVKAQLDLKAIHQMKAISREGGTIGLFPSGNGSFTGPEMPINLGTAKLARVLKLPVLLFRFEGGYLTRPRWGVTTRQGVMRGRVVRALSVDEIAAMTPEALLQVIHQKLDADPYRDDRTASDQDPDSTTAPRVLTQATASPVQLYKGRRLAEYLERVLFVCPDCHQLNTLRSKDDRLFCTCGFAIRYAEDGRFYTAAPTSAAPQTALTASPIRAALPHVKAFDQFQRQYLTTWLAQAGVLQTHQTTPFFTDEGETLSVVQRASHEEKTLHGQLALYSDRLAFQPAQPLPPNGDTAQVFPLEQIRFVAVHGPQTLQFQDARTNLVYEVHSDRPRSAYRYMVMIDLLKSRTHPNLTPAPQ
ncbi:MAG: lysophospholipid acyltransferase family protein [Eubacteriales bacterium]|nr:lysophospholipid acyltransferase family protein [Eubacteriales bacterium]